MPGLINTLNVMSRGMMAQRTGANTAANNIANVNTPGYSRQQVMLSSMDAPQGVQVLGVERAVDGFVSRRLDQQSALTGFASSHADSAAEIERVLGELGENGLSAALDQFYGGFRELAASPNDPALRAQALQRTSDLAARVNDAAEGLSAAQKQLNNSVPSHIDRANQIIDQIAGLNRSITELEAGGQQAPELRDQRDNAMRELAELTGAKGFEDDNGDYTVLIAGGVGIVQGDATRHLGLETDPGTGMFRVVTAEGNRIDLTDNIRGGQLGGSLQARDQDLPARMAELDNFAFDLATAANAVHSSGFGLDGNTGRDLFAAPAAVSGAAAALQVDGAVAANTDFLAAATDPAGLPGDGRGAQLMADLQSQTVASGGTRTLGAVLANIVADVGSASSAAQRDASLQGSRLEGLSGLYEQISGVNMEEQMLALSQFQRAFQASARVVNTVDEMLQEVVNLK